MEKICNKCHKPWPLDNFHRSQSAKDGHVSTCKTCRKAPQKKPVDQKSERRSRVNATLKTQPSEEQLKRKRAYSKTYRDKNRYKNKARQAVFVAVRGGTIKKPYQCELCSKYRKLSSHHWHGYDEEHWLDVLWLCFECHPKLDPYIDENAHDHEDGVFDLHGICELCKKDKDLTTWHWHGQFRKGDVIRLCESCYGMAKRQL